MSLLNEIQSTLQKEGISSKEVNDSYDTGIDIFDWTNCQYDNIAKNYFRGITAGTLNTIIGPSSSGKTSFAIQISTHIVKNIDNASIIHFDFEHSTSRSRILGLTGWSEEEFKNKYLFLNSGITTESFYKTIKSIAKIKLDKKEELEYDTGFKDSDGNPVKELPPTIVILDSIASMFSDQNTDEEEMSGQMSTTAQAKLNNQTIKRLVGSSTLEDGNIIILAINHITKKIEINAFAKTSAEIQYLKQDEAMPGGTSFPYLSNLLVKITPKTKLDPDSKNNTNNRYNIKGFISQLEIIKSRTAPAGQVIQIVYDQMNGFLNSLTNFQELVDNGIITGRGSYTIPGYDKKVKIKEVNDLYNEDPEFRKIIDNLAEEFYKTRVGKPVRLNDEEDLINDENVNEILEVNGLKLKLYSDDDQGGIWVNSEEDNNKFYDNEGNEIEIEIE